MGGVDESGTESSHAKTRRWLALERLRPLDQRLDRKYGMRVLMCGHPGIKWFDHQNPHNLHKPCGGERRRKNLRIDSGILGMWSGQALSLSI